MGAQFQSDMNKINVRQNMNPNNLRYSTPSSNTLPVSGMMSPNTTPLDMNHGVMPQNNMCGGMPSFDVPDIKPRIHAQSM